MQQAGGAGSQPLGVWPLRGLFIVLLSVWAGLRGRGRGHPAAVPEGWRYHAEESPAASPRKQRSPAATRAAHTRGWIWGGGGLRARGGVAVPASGKCLSLGGVAGAHARGSCFFLGREVSWSLGAWPAPAATDAVLRRRPASRDLGAGPVA